MTKIQNPLIGRASGQAGGMVFSTLYGQNILKAKPFEPQNPNSLAQQYIRGAFTRAVVVAKAVAVQDAATLPERGFAPKTLRGAIVRQFMNQVEPYAGGTGAIDYDSMGFGGGSLGTPTGLVQPTMLAGDLTVGFGTSLNSPSDLATDKVVVIVYNKTKNQAYVAVSAVERSAGTIVIDEHPGVAEDDLLEVWLGFVSADGSKASVRFKAGAEFAAAV